MEGLEWRNWSVKIKGAMTATICAPGKGVAIEYFMATRGILSTDDPIFCEPTDRNLYGSKEDVLDMFHGKLKRSDVERLDDCHSQHAGVAPMYAIATNITNAAHNSFSHGLFRTINQAMAVHDVPRFSVLCELGGARSKVIIKRYWDPQAKRGWLGTLDLQISSCDSQTSKVIFNFDGVFELSGNPVFPFMRDGDQIVDNGGKGRVIYIHRCAQCGRVFARNIRALVPVLCGMCREGEWTPQKHERKVTL